MKYRKKPIVIEAFQTDKEVVIKTLEGDMKANIGDYIITGVNGEQYPCKPDIFQKTYEQTDAQPNPTIRGRLIEAIKQIPILICGALRTDYAELLADHLIANGIGDITAEKHRADVAEEAMNIDNICYDEGIMTIKEAQDDRS